MSTVSYTQVCVCVCVCDDVLMFHSEQFGLCLIAQLKQEVSDVFSSLPQSTERHSHPHHFLSSSFPSRT